MGMSTQGSSYDWGTAGMNNNVPNNQPLSIDTGLSNTRSMPTTPASTPPGSSLSNMPNYPGAQNFEASKVFYSGPPSSQTAYAQQPTSAQAHMARFGGPLSSSTFPKTEMGPPTAPGLVSHGDVDQQDLKSEQHDLKHEPYDLKSEPYDLKPEPYGSGHVPNNPTERGATHQHETAYMNANAAANCGGNRASYGYNPPSSIVHGDHTHLSAEMTGSPHGNGSGRATPHSTNGSGSWQPDYQTPPRPAAPSSLYNVISDTKGPNGGPPGDNYTSSYGMSALNGASNSAKRSREDENVAGRPDSRGIDSALDMKRRKMLRQEPLGMSMGSMANLHGIKTGGDVTRQR